tara:strand:+ start:468 stop:794 length:327 start_codon:yes stop_codon:yes gene_type:complete
MRKDHESVQRRRETAVRVSTERAKRSPSQQLARLNERLGDGEGAEKERARLSQLIDATPERDDVSSPSPSPRPRQKKKAKERRKSSSQETRKQRKARLQSEKDRGESS